MEETKLKRMLSSLKSDVDMLLDSYHNSSQQGVAEMKKNISSLTTKVQEIRTELDNTTEQTFITTFAFADFKNEYTPKIESTETTANRVHDYFVEFLGYFLSESQKLEQVDIFDRMAVMEPIITKLRDHLDNLSSENGVSAEEFEALSTKVDSLDTAQSDLQTKYNALQQQMERYLTPPDPYYIGKTFTDYPAGTIWQTYDYDERFYAFEDSTSITTPTLYFTSEQASTGTIKLTQKFSVNDTGTITIKVYLNGELIGEQDYSTQADTEHLFEFELTDCNFNQESTANNIYTTFNYSTIRKTMKLTYQKVEVISPNARFISKNCPFDAYYFDGVYYLTDCTGGTLKTAQIEANEMHNMDNLTWTETNIPAVECIIHATYQHDSTFQYHPDKLYYFRKTFDEKYYVGDLTDGISLYLKDAKQLDSYVNANSSMSFAGTRYNNEYGVFCIYTPGTTNISAIQIDKTVSGYSRYSAAKAIVPKHYNTSTPIAIRQDNEANTIIGYICDATVPILSGINCTLIVCELTKTYNYTVNAYIKHCDKIIKQKIKCTSQTTFEILSTTEFGTYDKVFEMPNNDFFAVKNNKLHYFKMAEEEIESEE